MEVKKVAEEWEIWEEEVAKSGKETKKLVPQRFYKWIHILKKASERMLIMKLWDYVIEVKEEFILRKRKCIYCQKRRKERYMSLYKNN